MRHIRFAQTIQIDRIRHLLIVDATELHGQRCAISLMESDLVVSNPVEYVNGKHEPSLRRSPLDLHLGKVLRARLVFHYVIREIRLMPPLAKQNCARPLRPDTPPIIC